MYAYLGGGTEKSTALGIAGKTEGEVFRVYAPHNLKVVKAPNPPANAQAIFSGTPTTYSDGLMPFITNGKEIKLVESPFFKPGNYINGKPANYLVQRTEIPTNLPKGWTYQGRPFGLIEEAKKAGMDAVEIPSMVDGSPLWLRSDGRYFVKEGVFPMTERIYGDASKLIKAPLGESMHNTALRISDINPYSTSANFTLGTGNVLYDYTK